MRILLLVTAFNGLSQRIHQQLSQEGHCVSVVFATHERELRKTLNQFQPELILCPFLKHRIADDIWQNYLCIIIHPGITGDRGPSSLDWSILEQQPSWGVTALQADQEMDAGDIWGSQPFPMRSAPKASLYRQEVSTAAALLVTELMQHLRQGGFAPRPLNYADPSVKGELKPLIKQAQRRIDWLKDDTDTVLRKIHAADSVPGVLDEFCGLAVHLYGAHRETQLTGPKPKSILATRHGAICVATKDGAIWISHLKLQKTDDTLFIKLPATWVLQSRLPDVPEAELPLLPDYDPNRFSEISYLQQDEVGYLWFNFHNGAMGTEQCQRLLKAYQQACQRDIRVLVLMGGDDFWSNGIHLNHIEAAADPAAESWQNINAINDVVEAILLTDDKLTVAAVGNNAGAGGVMMALACDTVVARDGVVLNPHYQSMGLYGSEYWTYTLPKRVGEAVAQQLTQACLPVGSAQARQLGLVDQVLPGQMAEFQRQLADYAVTMARSEQYHSRLQAKRQTRHLDEQQRPLADFRRQELEQMHQCFHGFLSDYHRLRYGFVYKMCPRVTPPRLVHPLARKRPTSTVRSR
ncbi:hydrogenase maturation protein [Ferrimonas sp. SCSIO 43195]|uniref:hydrogenase maturation protein n=1 Tax=Ferrimonas sp. SCSIO 43195 TaxID=2822844 RepID=UPI0020750C71|nr:hydrogenase maturation protein [Ferrimonas sp. SCSIO 43195]USD36626.1 hydrogenase maturation protein [Ferrimonas sp. SCSIO 43195]